MFQAIDNNDIENIKNLLLNDIKYNINHKSKSSGNTLLIYTCKFGSNRCIKYLINKGANLSDENKNKESENYECIEYLLKFAVKNNIKNICKNSKFYIILLTICLFYA
jgi:ankyrin repeat protein